MKKILSGILSLMLVISCNCMVRADVQPNNNNSTVNKAVRYEAEAGVIKGVKTKIVSDAFASGGKKVGYLDVPVSDYVTFTVKVPTDGDYTIVERYDNGGGDNAKHTIIVNDKEHYTASLPKTGDWHNFANSERVAVKLNAGENKVMVVCTNFFAELDYIEVAPAGAEELVANIDLVSQLSNELRSVGNYVSNMGNDLNRVRFWGEARLRYSDREDGDPDWPSNCVDRYTLIYLGTTIKINDSWNATTLFQAGDGMFDRAGESGDDWGPEMSWCYVEGPVWKGTFTFGRFNYYPGHQLIYDNYTSGAKYSFGSKFPTAIFAGRAIDRRTTNLIGGDVRYRLNPVTNLSLVAITGSRDGATAETTYDDGGSQITTPYTYDWGEVGGLGSNDAAARTCVELSFDTKLSTNFGLMAGYAQSNANDFNQAYLVRLDYKGAKGHLVNSWGLWAQFASVEAFSTIRPGNEMYPNEEGLQLGFNYTLSPNVILTLWCFDGYHNQYYYGYKGSHDSNRSYARVIFYF